MEMLDKWAIASRDIVRDHEQKLRIDKKTNREVPGKTFTRAANIMSQMWEIFNKVKIRSVSCGVDYVFSDYYYNDKLEWWDK